MPARLTPVGRGLTQAAQKRDAQAVAVRQADDVAVAQVGAAGDAEATQSPTQAPLPTAPKAQKGKLEVRPAVVHAVIAKEGGHTQKGGQAGNLADAGPATPPPKATPEGATPAVVKPTGVAQPATTPPTAKTATAKTKEGVGGVATLSAIRRKGAGAKTAVARPMARTPYSLPPLTAS